MLSIQFDRAAIGISALCIAHCLVLPVALVLAPSVTLLTVLNDELFHKLLILLVLPTSIFALTLGCRQHKNFVVAGLATAGLMTLCMTAFFGHDYLGEELEKLFTLVGAILVALSHFFNFRLCQLKNCQNETKNGQYD